ncbi:MAG: hypothetical protein OHK0053_34970 [Microscillaceae bacterium]
MKVYESPYLWISFLPEHALTEITYLPTTCQMQEEEYKDDLLYFLRVVEQYYPTRQIVDKRNFFFPLSPTLQTWANEQIFCTAYTLGLETMAVVTHQSPAKDLAPEALIPSQPEDRPLHQRFFSCKKAAQDWILSYQPQPRYLFGEVVRP